MVDCYLHFLSVFGVYPGESRHPQNPEELPAMHPRVEQIELPSVATLMSSAADMKRKLPPRLPSLWYESTKLKRVENRWFADYYGHQQRFGQSIRTSTLPLETQRTHGHTSVARHRREGKVLERRRVGKKHLILEMRIEDERNRT